MLDTFDPCSNSYFFNLFLKSLGTNPKAPTTIATFIFHSFFSFLTSFKYLLIFLLSFLFPLWFAGPTMGHVLFFSSKLTLGLVFRLELRDPIVSQNTRECYGSHWTNSGL